MENSSEKVFLTVEDYKDQLWSCYNCFCGLCIENCPAFVESKKEACSARGLAQLGLALISGELDISELDDEIVYTCTGCGWCEWDCSMNSIDIIQRLGTRRTKISGETMTEIFRSMKVEKGAVPPEVRDALNNLAVLGNPYGGSKDRKDEWARSLGLLDENNSTVLYCGSLIPYDERATRMAEAIIAVFKEAQVEIGMLGSNEMDSGAFAMMMGEEGLFEEMLENSKKTFREHGVERLICLSPHDYDMFKNYHNIGSDVDVKHYTQVLSELIDNNQLRFRKEIKKKVTYHDPCYLGRKNDIFEEPRRILENIPGIELIEMDKNKTSSYCCGGGGSGLFYDIPGIEMNNTRADQAADKAVEYIIVACPICYQMLDDAVKSRDYQMEIKDISEMVRDAL
jgi:Fe-S oxidoreductase